MFLQGSESRYVSLLHDTACQSRRLGAHLPYLSMSGRMYSSKMN